MLGLFDSTKARELSSVVRICVALKPPCPKSRETRASFRLGKHCWPLVEAVMAGVITSIPGLSTASIWVAFGSDAISVAVPGVASVSRWLLSQLARTVIADADPPATYANDPWSRNATLRGATGSGGTLLSTSCGEYTNSVLPAAMNALKLSGEKSAEIALPMMNVSTRFEPVSNTRTRPPATSETITFTPSGEIARTLPGTCGTCDTPLVVRSTVINPAALPRKARLPAGLISSELGAEGRVIAVPAVFVLVSIGTIDVPALLAASTVVEF